MAERGSKLTKMAHYVWCDYHCNAHEAEPDPYMEFEYAPDATLIGDGCSRSWRPIYIYATADEVASGSEF